MKKILIFALTALIAVGCSDKALKTVYEGPSGFAFGSSVLNVEMSAEDGGQILVPVYRGTEHSNSAELKFEYDIAPEGSTQPQWVEADPSGQFSLSARKLLFPDGVLSSYAQIRLKSLEALGLTSKYRMRLSLLNDVSPSGRDKVVLTVNRKLTFDYLGKCEYKDNCIFEFAYKTDIYLAREAKIYRIMDPYSEGLVAEEYASEGWMGQPSPYIQLIVDDEGNISFEPFATGMMLNGKYMAYAYYPGEYHWGADFSRFNSENKVLSDKQLQIYPVYCLPEYSYGYLNEGAYPVDITLP